MCCIFGQISSADLFEKKEDEYMLVKVIVFLRLVLMMLSGTGLEGTFRANALALIFEFILVKL